MTSNQKDTKPAEQERRIAAVRTGTAPKANGTEIGYKIGREEGTDNLFLRVVANDGGGTFSKEWVPFEALKKIAGDVGKTAEPFRPGTTVAQAYVGKSRNNGPFLAYALLGEGLLERAGEKGTQAKVVGDWKDWEKQQLQLPHSKATDPRKTEPKPPSASRSKGKRRGKESKPVSG